MADKEAFLVLYLGLDVVDGIAEHKESNAIRFYVIL
jgi:hypothetical protein